MDEQRKLRNLLSYTKTDSVEELEDVNKLYNDINDYINKSQKEHELLGLYQTFHGLFSLNSEVESYDDNWGMPADCETLLSNNPLSETNIVDEKMIDLFHQIEQLEKEIEEMK